MATKKTKQTFDHWNLLWIAVILAIVYGFVAYIVPALQSGPSQATDTQPSPTSANIQAVYTCDGGKHITATYLNDVGKVNLQLSSGKTILLPHAMSANGARYANADESIVFWNVGNTAFLEENGIQTYANCETTH